MDWGGYLTQQRRWARSVIDVKLRLLPKLGGRLLIRERLTSFMQGLYYLNPLFIALGIGVLVWMLVTGATPEVFSFGTAPALVLMLAALAACDRYRQRFYLDPQHETGLH